MKSQVQLRSGKYRVEVFNSLDLSYSTATYAIQQLQKILNDAIAHGNQDADLEISIREEYGDSYVRTQATYWRDATQKEIDEFLKEQEQYQKSMEEREKKMLADLQKKYGKK